MRGSDAAIGSVRSAWTRVEAGRDRRSAGDELLATLAASGATDAGDPGIGRRCRVCGSTAHGAPELPHSGFVASLAYAGGSAVAVVAPTDAATAIGVDAEAADADPPLDLLHPSAITPGGGIRSWTRVEAVLKADGRGLRVDPGLVRFAPAGDALVARVGDDQREYIVRELPGPPGVVVSVAVLPAAAAAPDGRATDAAPARRRGR